MSYDQQLADAIRENETLRAEVLMLKARLDGTTSAIPAIVANHTRSLTSENEQLQRALTTASKSVAEEARLRGVLEWYATGYGAHPKGHCGDYGERARAALSVERP